MKKMREFTDVFRVFSSARSDEHIGLRIGRCGGWV